MVASTRAREALPSPEPPGVVYTPPKLATFVVDRLLDGVPDVAGLRWLDPCCGDGIFLVEAVRRLAQIVDAGELAAATEAQLVGVDVDPQACERARAAVTNAVRAHGGVVDDNFFAANVHVADFLSLEAEHLGRFSLIVGNPPYVSATALGAHSKQAYARRFESAWGRLDLYALFIEQAVRLLAAGGRVAFITPDKFLTSQSSRPLRAMVARNARVTTVDRFDRHDLFLKVATVPCVTVITNDGRSQTAICRWWDAEPGGTPQPRVGGDQAIRIDRDGAAWQPPRAAHRPGTVRLARLVERISAGWATGLNGCFVLDARGSRDIEPALLRPAVRGRDVLVDGIAESGLALLLPYEFGEGGRAQLVDLGHYPGAASHLRNHRERLEQRHCVRVWRKEWYDLHDPVVSDLSVRPKILLPDIAYEPRFVYTTATLAPLHSTYFMLPRADVSVSPEALTALLNSRALVEELRRCSPIVKSRYRRFRSQFLRDLPIPVSDEIDQLALFEDDAGDSADELMTWALRRDAA